MIPQSPESTGRSSLQSAKNSTSDIHSSSGIQKKIRQSLLEHDTNNIRRSFTGRCSTSSFALMKKSSELKFEESVPVESNERVAISAKRSLVEDKPRDSVIITRTDSKSSTAINQEGFRILDILDTRKENVSMVNRYSTSVRERNKTKSRLSTFGVKAGVSNDEGQNLVSQSGDFTKMSITSPMNRRDETDTSIINSELPHERDFQKLKRRQFNNNQSSKSKRVLNIDSLLEEENGSPFHSPKSQTHKLDITGSKIRKDKSVRSRVKLVPSSLESRSNKETQNSGVLMNILRKKLDDQNSISITAFKDESFVEKSMLMGFSSTMRSFRPSDVKNLNKTDSRHKAPVKERKLVQSILSQKSFPLPKQIYTSLIIPHVEETTTKNNYFTRELGPRYVTKEDVSPKVRSPKNVMISSKHNYFRRKPQKGFLEQTRYLSPPIGNKK